MKTCSVSRYIVDCALAVKSMASWQVQTLRRIETAASAQVVIDDADLTPGCGQSEIKGAATELAE